MRAAVANRRVVATRVSQLGVGEVSPLGQQLVHRGEVLGRLRLVQHDLPLGVKLGGDVRREARPDGLRLRLRRDQLVVRRERGGGRGHADTIVLA